MVNKNSITFKARRLHLCEAMILWCTDRAKSSKANSRKDSTYWEERSIFYLDRWHEIIAQIPTKDLKLLEPVESIFRNRKAEELQA